MERGRCTAEHMRYASGEAENPSSARRHAMTICGNSVSEALFPTQEFGDLRGSVGRLGPDALSDRRNQR